MHRVITQFISFAEHEVGVLDHVGLGHIDRALFETGIRELRPALSIDLGKTQVHETHGGIEKTELEQPVF